MNEKFGVSGLLALNNVDNYTRAAIDSILNQSRPVDELVIVVNGRQRESIIKTLSEWYSNLANVKLVNCVLEQLYFALNLGLTH